MSDQTTAALERIREHAASANAVVERVEITTRAVNGKTEVQFTASLAPKPLAQTQICTSYIIGEEQ